MSDPVPARSRPRPFSPRRLLPGVTRRVAPPAGAAVRAPGPGAARPLTAVLEAFGDGAGTLTLDEIARTRGLDPDLVRAAAEHLVRTGRLTAGALSAGCPEGTCGGCPLSRGSAGPGGCGGPGGRGGPQDGSGRALVVLSRPPAGTAALDPRACSAGSSTAPRPLAPAPGPAGASRARCGHRS